MLRVLIIDDSKVIQKVVSKQALELGLQVVGVASDGDEGIDLFKKHKPYLTLLDISMPNKDGRECLREILEMEPKANVIMLSALNSPEIVSECLALGAKAFLNKGQSIADGSLKIELSQVITKIAA